ncbi:MAG: hypothetical protein V8T91_06605 [Ruminococcus sp.]
MHYLQGRYPVLEKKILAKNMVQYVILCPEIAAAAQPGQFVHILPVGHTLRRPISLCGIDKKKGTICIVFELKGSGTETLAACNVGDCMDVLALWDMASPCCRMQNGWFCWAAVSEIRRCSHWLSIIRNGQPLSAASAVRNLSSYKRHFRLLVQKQFSAPITERSDGMDWSQNRCKNCCKPSRLMRCMPAAEADAPCNCEPCQHCRCVL